MMRAKTPLILLTLGAFTLMACDVDPNAYPNDPNARAKRGAAIGAVTGAIIGGQGSGDNTAQVIGGAILGGIAGAAIGNSLDRQAAELRGSLGGNIGVVNTGNELVVTMPQDLLFAVDSASVRPDLQADLRTVAGSLQRYPDTTVQVVGHTDNTGAAAYNQDLSQRRAGAVASVLIGAGVPSGRIVAFGRGEDQPVASNLTPEGRAQNRRVEIIIRPN